MTYPECRICREGAEPNNHLFSPCLCKGSMKHVHSDCLERWRQVSENALSKYRCENCLYYYRLENSGTEWLSWSVLALAILTALSLVYLLFHLVRHGLLLTFGEISTLETLADTMLIVAFGFKIQEIYASRHGCWMFMLWIDAVFNLFADMSFYRPPVDLKNFLFFIYYSYQAFFGFFMMVKLFYGQLAGEMNLYIAHVKVLPLS